MLIIQHPGAEEEEGMKCTEPVSVSSLCFPVLSYRNQTRVEDTSLAFGSCTELIHLLSGGGSMESGVRGAGGS